MGRVLSEENVVFANHDNVYRKEENGAYLYNPETGALKYLNRTGVEIFDLCDGIHRVQDIVTIMQANYPEEIGLPLREEVSCFIKRLIDCNYLIINTDSCVKVVGEE